MDKKLRAQVFETYNRYLNAFNEADMETINDCISYPLAYIGADSVKMLDKFPIDPREWKNHKAIVLGCGGSARAVIAGLQNLNLCMGRELTKKWQIPWMETFYLIIWDRKITAYQHWLNESRNIKMNGYA